MVLEIKGTRFFDEKVLRHGYLISAMKEHLWHGIVDGKIEEEQVMRLGERIRDNLGILSGTPAHQEAGERFSQLQRAALALPPAQALKLLLQNIESKTSREIERIKLARSIKAGRKAEREGGYELMRGIAAYNKWLGTNLQAQVRELAKRHGPIVVLDAGGGVGVAMADLKNRVGKHIQEAHVTSLTQHFPTRVEQKSTERVRVEIPRPYGENIAPIMHVTHAEKLPLASSSVHLIVSVRGATWYTTRSLHRSVAEMARVMQPGGKAFLHITEPSGEMEKALERVFQRENLKHSFKYGIAGVKRVEAGEVKNVLDVFDSEIERDKKAVKLEKAKEQREFDNVVKYRVLQLVKT